MVVVLDLVVAERAQGLGEGVEEEEAVVVEVEVEGLLPQPRSIDGAKTQWYC